MQKAIILLSGGLDSATVLWSMKDSYEIHALSYRYGNTNRREMKAVRGLARAAKVREHLVVDVGFLKDISELMGKEEAERVGLPSCYIPARNTIFFGIAAYFAEVNGIDLIVTGHNIEDNFPDSRREYYRAINRALAIGSRHGKGGPKVIAPFLKKTKAQILQLALKLRVPLEMTWSCYEDGPIPCGVCNGCRSMKETLREVRSGKI